MKNFILFLFRVIGTVAIYKAAFVNDMIVKVLLLISGFIFLRIE